MKTLLTHQHKEFLIEWILDIKTLLATLFVLCLVFYVIYGRDENVYNLAKELLTAIIALAVGYRLGQSKQSTNPSDGANQWTSEETKPPKQPDSF